MTELSRNAAEVFDKMKTHIDWKLQEPTKWVHPDALLVKLVPHENQAQYFYGENKVTFSKEWLNELASADLVTSTPFDRQHYLIRIV